MMGGIGLPELLIILVIIMIIFGAGKIPGIGSAFGKTISNFKKSMKETGEADSSSEEDTPQPHLEVADAEEPKAVPERVESTEAVPGKAGTS